MQDIKQQKKIEELKELLYELAEPKDLAHKSIGSRILTKVDELISLAVEQEKERVLAMVLKEIEESKEECTECANREKHDTPINNALDTLKEKLQAKQ